MDSLRPYDDGDANEPLQFTPQDQATPCPSD